METEIDRTTNLDLRLMDSGDLLLQERGENEAKFKVLSGKPFAYWGAKIAVNVENIDLTQFAPDKTPTVTFMHVDEWIVGRAPWGVKRVGDALFSSMIPSPSAFAQEKWAEVQGDFIRAASAEIVETVNFWDESASLQYEKDTGKKAPKGLLRYVQGGKFRNWSLVPFGAHQDALKNAAMRSTNPTSAASLMFAMQMETFKRLESKIDKVLELYDAGMLGQRAGGATALSAESGDISGIRIDTESLIQVITKNFQRNGVPIT